MAIKAYVEKWNAPAPSQPAATVADEIRRLKQLVDEGFLTDEEFAARKKQVPGI